MKSYLAIAMVALVGMTALSAKATVILPGGNVGATNPHVELTQDYVFYNLPNTVYSGDVEIMNGPEILELCHFVPDSGNAAYSHSVELIPVNSDIAPPLLSPSLQLESKGWMTDYYPGDNSYCIGDPVPVPASGKMTAVGVVMAMAVVAFKSRRRVAVI